MLVHGEDGMDEITTTGKTYVIEVHDKNLKRYEITPQEFGMHPASISDFTALSIKERGDIILRILRGERGPKTDIALINASAAIYVSGLADSLQMGLDMAKESIHSQKALRKLEELIEWSNRDWNQQRFNRGVAVEGNNLEKVKLEI